MMIRIGLLLILALLTNPASADELFRQYRYESFRGLPECEEGDIVFIGNSITNMFNWWEAFGARQNIHGRGTSGGYTQEILDNLENMISGNPSKVFLMIGTNDLGTAGEQYLPKPTATRIIQILRHIRSEAPDADVYYQSILPSKVGLRTPEKILQTNSIVYEWIENQHDTKLTYIDLYTLFADADGDMPHSDRDKDALSFDGLHLTQRGYLLWTKLIEPLVGYKSVIADKRENNCGGVGGSTGMRYTYFDALPIKGSDILFFGDDMVHNVEWHELMGSSDIKDRGAGWGKNALSLEAIQSSFVPALQDKRRPRAICLLAGMTDVSWQTDINTICKHYYQTIDSLHTLAPGVPLFVVNLMPAANDVPQLNKRINTLNAAIALIAKKDPKVYLVDIHTVMTNKDGIRNEEYFIQPSEHLPSAAGNRLIAHRLAIVMNNVLGTKMHIK